MTTTVDFETPSIRSRAARTIAVLLTAALVITGIPFTPSANASSGPIPSVSLTVPTGGLLGEAINVKATFTNSSVTLSDVGYGPYVDLILPGSGADGAAVAPGADGITFTNASYLGISLVPAILACPVGGGIFPAHPVTGATGPACNQGDQLVVLAYPIGSYAPGNPPLVADINLALSANADVGTALAVKATSGFQFGNSPTGTPITSGTTTSSNFTPEIYTIRKTYNGPEHETASGPNYVRSYTVIADIATGQTLTNFNLRDTLPAGFAYMNPPVPTTSPAGASITLQPNVANTATEPASTSNGVSASQNIVQATWASVTGGASTSDVTMTYSYYVPRQYNANQPGIGGTAIINAANGQPTGLTDSASSSGNWQPTDPRDSNQVVPRGPVTDTMSAKSIAIQKAPTIFADNGAPGATRATS